MYGFGRTVIPVCPTWSVFGTQPLSTAFRDAAMAPPRRAASSWGVSNAVRSPRPSPPAPAAAASSGRSPPSRVGDVVRRGHKHVSAHGGHLGAVFLAEDVRQGL